MLVTYSPTLAAQIQARRMAQARTDETPVTVFIMASDSFVKRVDPVTRQATDEHQQFRRGRNGSLTILPRSLWVDDPVVLQVGEMRF